MNIYEVITDRILEEMRNGRIPWRMPWTFAEGSKWNRVTGKGYSLLNCMLLRKNGEWATFKQWKDAGGEVKKGAKSRMVCFWKPYEMKDAEPIGMNEDGTLKYPVVPVLRYYNVFHIDDVEGVTAKHKSPAEELAARPEPEKHEISDRLLSDYFSREKIEVQGFTDAEFSDKACYSPTFDTIKVPNRKQFKEQAEYYSTLFHETVHSTGHSSRLNRHKFCFFGDDDYSKEELVAELGSAFLMNQVGIEQPSTFKNSVAYLQGWMSKLQSDPKLIVFAASQAEKAVKFIKGEIAAAKKDEVEVEAAGE